MDRAAAVRWRGRNRDGIEMKGAWRGVREEWIHSSDRKMIRADFTRFQKNRCWMRWLVPGVLLVAMPKCFLCVVAYLALATGLGVSGRELCGGATEAGGGAAVASLMLAIGAAVGVIGYVMRKRRASGRRVSARWSSLRGEPALSENDVRS